MRMLLAIAIVVSACSHDPEPPPCPAPPPAPVRIAAPPLAKPRVPLDAVHWQLRDNAARFASDGIAMHYCCTSAGRATHRLAEINRSGTWTISVHHRKTDCEDGLTAWVHRPDAPLRTLSLARFAHGHATLAVTVDGSRDELDLEMVAEGGKSCCGDVTFDRVELERSDIL